MINWNGLHDEVFKLSIASYEFPEAFDGYDANWLTLDVSAHNELGSWNKKCACLLTWELSWLYSWLENVVEGNAENEFCGMEQDLRFMYLAHSGSQYRFAAILRYGFAFNEAHNDQAAVLNLVVTEQQLAETLESVKEAIAKHPPRGKQGNKSASSLLGPKYYNPHEK